jgi:membrane protease YdiL (CAAX protease family)
MTRTKVFLLGLLTLLGFPSIGWAILELYVEKPFTSIFDTSQPLVLNIGFGLGYGLLCGMAAWELIKMNFFKRSRIFFSDLIGDLNLGWVEIIFISSCAGIGEEILFRGAVQPILGIWITAVLFIALHGYLNPQNWQISVYGLFMCPVIAGMGYLCEELGIWAAISAHAIFDVYLFKALSSPGLKRD